MKRKKDQRGNPPFRSRHLKRLCLFFHVFAFMFSRPDLRLVSSLVDCVRGALVKVQTQLLKKLYLQKLVLFYLFIYLKFSWLHLAQVSRLPLPASRRLQLRTRR